MALRAAAATACKSPSMAPFCDPAIAEGRPAELPLSLTHPLETGECTFLHAQERHCNVLKRAVKGETGLALAWQGIAEINRVSMAHFFRL
ncbi:hypothetical protein SKAU_G00164970 [Synaphobranchus kaupii]|uniref:Uncharacterized protein n=1 Tax=Synaphobranchus kaupii TaxID=118154 RepID=A0A9Q1J092_SYNKA|nr:hypothetical protein SKAU_G00164970 [Synaphobranchus kaupii]